MFEQYFIVGNAGKDPEMRFTPSGQAVCNFSVGVNHQYTNSNGEQVKETKWVRVVTWGKQAETCNQYVKKGSKVLVVGRLNADKETGSPKVFQKQDGSWGSSFEMTASTVRFLSPRAEGGMTDTARELGGEETEVPF